MPTSQPPKCPRPAAHSTSQTVHTLEGTVKVHLRYLLYLPNDYDKKGNWPLMLFLHGAGERGDNLELVKKHGPPKLIEEGKAFPFVVVSPQCPEDRWWEPVSLSALLDEIVGKYKIDKDRIYVTGLSMGGFGTWSLATYAPRRFAAIVPICGGGEPITAQMLASVPAWVFHGGKDPVVPLARSQGMVDAMKRAGGNVNSRSIRTPATIPGARPTPTPNFTTGCWCRSARAARPAVDLRIQDRSANYIAISP